MTIIVCKIKRYYSIARYVSWKARSGITHVSLRSVTLLTAAPHTLCNASAKHLGRGGKNGDFEQKNRDDFGAFGCVFNSDKLRLF